MSRRFALIAALAAALLLPGTATATTATVNVRDNSFVNGSPTILLGGTVAWQRESGGNPHTTTSDKSGLLPNWSMSIPGIGTPTATVEFDRAGGFAYHCEVHPGMRGTVLVQLSPNDSTPQVNQTVTITFALASAPSGYSEQIQKRKAGGTWRDFSVGNTGTTVNWKPTRARTFQFRARLVHGSEISNWSPTLSLTVSP